MAIVQISRITHRKGLSENLPQLAGAEFGWVIDERRLFIGNGTLQEGAPAIGNTEILTQYSDIFAIAGTYTYKGEAGGYIVQTGPTLGDPVQRTLQDKLDDMASVKDFGAIGDGVADDTDAINRALYQLFCRESAPEVRRSLFFPAGVYRVTYPIEVPPYAKLYGEGPDSSIIELDVAADSTYGQYVARTSDSLQQTGVNIGNNGATPPQRIEIYDMSFQTIEEADIFCIENAAQMLFQGVNFVGPFTQTYIENNSGTVESADIACVRFLSTTSLITNHITFNACRFTGTTYAFSADEQIQGVTVQSSKLDTLYKGVLLGVGTTVNGGPVGFRLMSNLFDSISQEGIIFGDVENNMSGYNIFLDVGTNFQGGNYTPVSPIIIFNGDNNVSVGDMFERDETFNLDEPRIKINNAKAFALDKAQRYKFGYYVREVGDSTDISVGSNTAFTIQSELGGFGYEVKYQYRVPVTNQVRYGTLTIISEDSDDSSSGPVTYTDEYTENANVGLTLSVDQGASDIDVNYTSTTEGVLKYTISYLS